MVRAWFHRLYRVPRRDVCDVDQYVGMIRIIRGEILWDKWQEFFYTSYCMGVRIYYRNKCFWILAVLHRHHGRFVKLTP